MDENSTNLSTGESEKGATPHAKESRKRLFIGFPIEVDSSLEAALKRTRIGADRRRMELYWVPVANYHVTLSFLGNTNTERIPELIEILAKVAESAPPAKTSLRGLGAFPDERHMRVLYVGMRKSRALADLQSRLQDALIEARFPQENRDYTPHLTVARLRKSRAGTDLLSPYVRTSFGDVHVRSIVLYESLLHGPTPVYKELHRFALTGAPVEETEEQPV